MRPNLTFDTKSSQIANTFYGRFHRHLALLTTLATLSCSSEVTLTLDNFAPHVEDYIIQLPLATILDLCMHEFTSYSSECILSVFMQRTVIVLHT